MRAPAIGSHVTCGTVLDLPVGSVVRWHSGETYTATRTHADTWAVDGSGTLDDADIAGEPPAFVVSVGTEEVAKVPDPYPAPIVYEGYGPAPYGGGDCGFEGPAPFPDQLGSGYEYDTAEVDCGGEADMGGPATNCDWCEAHDAARGCEHILSGNTETLRRVHEWAITNRDDVTLNALPGAKDCPLFTGPTPTVRRYT